MSKYQIEEIISVRGTSLFYPMKKESSESPWENIMASAPIGTRRMSAPTLEKAKVCIHNDIKFDKKMIELEESTSVISRITHAFEER